jgi:hypothetical protein
MSEQSNGIHTRYPEPVPVPEGPFYPSAQSGGSSGFDAAEGWDSYYNLRLKDEDASGYIPMPSQTKIDNFQRTIAKLFVDLDEAEKKERDARAEADNRTAEEKMAEVDEALKLKREVMDRFRDALANVCSSQPTRKQLGKLNEPTLLRFLEFVGRLLNPNV